MAELVHTVQKGIVLRETETREADKILTVLTAEQGKLAVIAKGARRKRSRYTASAQPLVYSEWTLYHRGAWYYANDAETIALFGGLRKNLDALALGFYFAELTEAVTEEDVPAPDLLRHLLNGLYALSELKKPPALVKAAFEWKLLCLAGYEPLVDACVVCGRPTPEAPVFDVVQGVLHCRACGGVSQSATVPLTPGALAALRHVVYGDPKRLYAFRLGTDDLRWFAQAAERFLLAQFDRGFRTLDFYKSLQSPPVHGSCIPSEREAT